MTGRFVSSRQPQAAERAQGASGTAPVLSDRRDLAVCDQDIRANGTVRRDHRPADDGGDVHEAGQAARLSATGEEISRTRPEAITILGTSSRSTTSVSPAASGSDQFPARNSKSETSAGWPGASAPMLPPRGMA